MLRSLLWIFLPAICLPSHAGSLIEQNELLLQSLQREQGLSDGQTQRIREIFRKSGFIGQGNPSISVHPMTPQQCRDERAGSMQPNVGFSRICGRPFMAPLYDPKTQTPDQASACIDQFEFPDIPCEYPVVWVRAKEAAEICEVMGKRLCDAHEWEGACDGRLLPPDYRFDLARGRAPAEAQSLMRFAHNKAFSENKRWSYGPTYKTGVCGTASHKTADCPGGGWSACGSNTYPTGAFPQCHSNLGVYDLNGNAAEHMNLPLDPSQMSSRGSQSLGYTEMKGSWFVFDSIRAHEDWCRWRAPYWHGGRVMAPNSHANYHLGFRCCNSLAPH
ncbi:hypothetical protein DIC66_21615 [Rhodoferax lacus]|uniref:Sulfatase-modifying factor enzyme-like domain-containing protein n=1 Tax=Rhodoferax lacus TaxID=2184758 RepID=A0A3E1R6G4_9BURK|nr:SUMF1/EgtB/PvdO family nonheme iron enzyme [Rhodoferax lacus]RFO94813.1 hypothetical protein DIC66_21615 [Rhodoferax lacus]